MIDFSTTEVVTVHADVTGAVVPTAHIKEFDHTIT